ncbi:MAG: GNAT family N-acetyltransferase [Coprobacillaceae bacterium]
MTNNTFNTKYTLGLNDDAKRIREEVFIKEQGFEDEFDQYDDVSYHAVIYTEDNIPVATARTYKKEGSYIIGRVAVIQSMRKHHLGKRVVFAIEGKIKQLGGRKIELSAQTRVQGFYESLGYQAEGEEYLDEHCPHIKMVKNI